MTSMVCDMSCFFVRSLNLEISDTVEEQHQLVVKLWLNAGSLESRSGLNLAISLSLFDTLECAQNIAKVASKQVYGKIERLVVRPILDVKRQDSRLVALLFDD